MTKTVALRATPSLARRSSAHSRWRMHRTSLCRSFVALVACCVSLRASPLDAAEPSRSDLTLTHMLVGRWFEGDPILPHRGAFGPGFDRLPHRMELTLSADGSCVYRVIPRQPNWPASVTHGQWSVANGVLKFAWSERDTVYKHPIDTGKVRALDHHHLDIQDEVGFRSFFRSRKDSEVQLH
jgi:hypothetical protein